MIIKQIVLYNCGAYAGKHIVDLTVEPNKPIVLIGGNNGGGKTTLFESILLCLYGMRYTKTTKKAYEKRLTQLIHRQKGDGLANTEEWSSVAVRLLIYKSGAVEEYEVQRRWRRAKDGAVEELAISRIHSDDDDEEVEADLNMMTLDQKQAVVNGLVPRGIADLFFFDGEKIHQIAENGESTAIKQSFNSLLGLDTVEQLQSDLRIILARSITGDDKHLQEKFSKLNTEKESLESSITHLRERLIYKESEINKIRSSIENAEAQLDIVGGSYARSYQDIKTKLATNKAKMEMVGRRIAELCAGELPFGLLNREMDNIKRQMELERRTSKAMTEYEAIQKTVFKIKSAIESVDDIQDQALAKITMAVDNALPPEPPKVQKNDMFGFSAMQQEFLTHVIDVASGKVLESASKDSQEYAMIREKVYNMEDAINRTPTDDEIGPIISKIKQMYEEAGRVEAEIAHLEKEIASGEAMIKIIISKIRGVLDGKYKNKKMQRMADLTILVQNALDGYSERLKKEKIGLLESHITNVINILMHKGMIKSVSIDTDTFEMRLYDSTNQLVPRDTISTGEHQMVATSVLWALARTSGRPLPFMIDTPLARLDRSHRINLIEQFFPQASHQILLLSTDEEIDEKKYPKLYPYISRSYTVQYDPESGSTKIKDGYFWDEAKKA